MSPKVSSPLTTEYALLGFLHQQPMHGYEIHRHLSEAKGIGLVWHVKQNQLYALLGKLERKGYVTVEVEPQENRPPRKVFHLTDAGRTAFQLWVRSPVKHGRKLRLDFLAKLYFARQEGPEVVTRLIEEQRAACQEWLTEQQAKADAEQNGSPFDWLVYEFRVGQLEATLKWLDTCEQALSVAMIL